MHKLYEELFRRAPIALLKHSWFLENISLTPHASYQFFKRAMDITISIPLLLVTIPFCTIAVVGTYFTDKGSVFFRQVRVGRGGAPIRITKFRTMTEKENVDVLSDKSSRVTKFGSFLRKSRIDELPQLWNVIKGELSLIGPRPEIPELVSLYEKEIPYYNIRHLVTPGISGWAQLYHENHPHHGSAVLETKEKLSYDLYYIKNRSFLLDVKIAIKTIKALLSRTGV